MYVCMHEALMNINGFYFHSNYIGKPAGGSTVLKLQEDILITFRMFLQKEVISVIMAAFKQENPMKSALFVREIIHYISHDK